MLIGEFSRIRGVSADTLRYYDKIGLLVPQREGKKRIYTEDDAKRLEIINELKAMGFSLDDIKITIELDDRIDGNLKSKKRCTKEASQCLNIIEEKYMDVLRQEQALLKTKKRLKHIKDKLEHFIEEEGKSNER